MDKSVPAGAAILLNFIGSIEAPKGYGTIYGNNQSKLPKPITGMTLDQVEAAGPGWTKKYGSSACGRYQFMRNTLDTPGTLTDIEGEMGLTGKELFSPNLQDRMGHHLLKRRGYDQFMAGRIGIPEFGKRLAQEWASFPVLAATKGAHRKVARGETYYAGDRLNKALVEPEKIESVLASVLAAGSDVAAPTPRPRPAPRPADEPEAEPDNGGEPEQGITDKATVERVQTQLWDLGYTEVGNIDGKVGKFTKTAILAFRNENDLPLVPIIDEALLAALPQAKPRDLGDRADMKADEVREVAPEAKSNWWSKLGAWVLGIPAAIGGAVTGAMDAIPGAREVLAPIKEFASDVPPWMWFVAVGGVALGIYLFTRKTEVTIKQAVRAGERR